ncbi:MAG: IS91 family transposase [Tissierellia bacterium]|nr:IS91 family transposase [Tissierellia bacterium]
MIEVQDIFNTYGAAYRSTRKLSKVQYKAMSAIENCRTAKLGGHVDICDECGYTQNSYNSCRNRHCPKCQTLAKERWIDNQKYDLLNVGYFHVVLTIPSELNSIVIQNQKVMYNILFKAAAETLTELASDKKYLGAKIGFTCILHTWGQNLMHHPHVHCIVPGGGLNSIGQWVNSRKKFFLPVKVLSRKFRGKFLHYLKQAELKFYGNQKRYETDNAFQIFLNILYDKEWIVYCKAPFKDAISVVEYLGRYTHRVAISNNRILNIKDGNVSFKWRDYKDNNKWKVMTLTADEFIRRFLIHILPQRFIKIRHYGFLGNRNKNTKLKICKQLTNTPILLKEKTPTLELIKTLIGRDITLCPKCKSNKFNRYPGISPPNIATAT